MSASDSFVFGNSDGAPPAKAATGATGALIGERYRLELSIGSGGMGCVHLATDTFTGGTVAIKTLRPDLATDMLVRSRLQREASIGARVKSRNVVRLLDHGDDEKAGPYIVFEYLRGESLADVLDRRRSLGPLDAVRIAIDVLEGLAAFHGSGLVHRDVKPENVFLVREREADGSLRHTARLIDFGLSRAIASTQDGTERVTLDGIVAGTPEYMAPEQISDSAGQDQHVDLYATGVMLYQMLSGKLPFAGEKTEAIFDRVLAGGARPLAEVAPSVDTGVARIVHRAMIKDPAKRYHSAAEMVTALRAWEARHVESGRAGELDRTQKLAALEESSTPRKSAAPKKRKPRRRALRAVLTASGGAAVALILGLFAMTRHNEPASIAHNATAHVLDARVSPSAPPAPATPPRNIAAVAHASPPAHATISNRAPVLADVTARETPSVGTPRVAVTPVARRVVVRRPPPRRAAFVAARPVNQPASEATARPSGAVPHSLSLPDNPY